PVMSPQRWEALLDAGIRELEALRQRYARDGTAFLDGEPKKLLHDLYYLGESRGAAVYGLIAASKLFVVGPPGGPDAGDFLEDRLRRVGLGPAAPTAILLTSADPEQTAPLAALVGKYRCQVVAPPAAAEAVRAACPAGTKVLTTEE